MNEKLDYCITGIWPKFVLILPGLLYMVRRSEVLCILQSHYR
jgi:hypothetical protein